MTALDFGPVGDVDVTGNVMESVPCGPLVHENAVPETGHPLVHVNLAHSELDSGLMQKVLHHVHQHEPPLFRAGFCNLEPSIEVHMTRRCKQQWPCRRLTKPKMCPSCKLKIRKVCKADTVC